MKITRGYETFSAESIAEIHFVLEVSFLILRKQEAEMKEWYQISAEEVKKKMETSEHGLTTEEAAKRLAQYGENVLAEGKKKSVFAVFFGQFADRPDSARRLRKKPYGLPAVRPAPSARRSDRCRIRLRRSGRAATRCIKILRG